MMNNQLSVGIKADDLCGKTLIATLEIQSSLAVFLDLDDFAVEQLLQLRLLLLNLSELVGGVS